MRHFFSNTVAHYCLAGTGLGLLFPIIGIIFETTSSGLPFTAGTLFALHNLHPFLWVIDMVPILLGFVGLRQGRIRAQAAGVEERLQVRNAELDLANNRIEQETEVTKQLETVITHDKEEWEAIFDAVPDMIFLVNTGGAIVRCNSAVTERFNLDYAQLTGTTLAELLFPDDPGNKLQISEIEIKKLGGYFDVFSRKIGAGTDVQRTIYILHDTTQRRLANNSMPVI